MAIEHPIRIIFNKENLLRFTNYKGAFSIMYTRVYNTYLAGIFALAFFPNNRWKQIYWAFLRAFTSRFINATCEEEEMLNR